jgi:uncharacterized circularly permuted ATP-grasp superfamily protein
VNRTQHQTQQATWPAAQAAWPTTGSLKNYSPGKHFCEMVRTAETDDPAIALLRARLDALSLEQLAERSRRAERELLEQGVTFTVYSDATAIDRILPLDLIPRVLTAAEWQVIETGVAQRVAAINAFLHDIYHDQHILKAGLVPPALVLGNKAYRAEMRGVSVPHGCYAHVCGIDLVRDENGQFLVLEDNARTPSGVSYVIENRGITLRLLSDLLRGMRLREVDEYGLRLHRALREISPAGADDPKVVLLSPGIYNSAYFEHVFLAREMGVPLVEGRDLVVEDDRVFMRTTGGLVRVDSIYRRIDDDFLDPAAFRADSQLGVRGLFQAWRKGNVGLANAVGTGVADDKAIYAYMPRIIRHYLSEEPILPIVATHICAEPEGLAYTRAHLSELVVKPVAESGGYGIFMGPRASMAETVAFREKLDADPANFISQPLIDLSVSPTLAGGGIGARHLDFRPFAVTGKTTWVLPGGLTRVALREGGLIVNSSQGGGTKDTWVLA